MESKNLVTAYIEWLMERPSYAITLTFNWLGGIMPASAEEKIREFGAFIDRARLGSRFYKKPVEARTKFILVPEKFGGGYPHYHGVIQCPPEDGTSIAGADRAALFEGHGGPSFPPAPSAWNRCTMPRAGVDTSRRRPG